MKGRQYSRQIAIYITLNDDDGYGGTTPDASNIKTVWAKVETVGAGRKFKDFGLNEFKNPVIFRIRNTGIVFEVGMFIKYSGSDFFVKGIEKVDFEGRELNVFCDSIN